MLSGPFIKKAYRSGFSKKKFCVGSADLGVFMADAQVSASASAEPGLPQHK